MNETWQKIAKDYIECYEALKTLVHNAVIDDALFDELKIRLLTEIIETFRSEVE